VPRIKAQKRSELELFWRGHLEGWRRSELNQREYCELHGLPLKRFGNWRAKLKDAGEERTYKLLYRRGGGLKHMPEHMLHRETGRRSAGYVPSARLLPPGGRRRFSKADKKRVVEEASQPGASVSSVARRYGIGTRLLFQWKQELEQSAPAEARFLPVTVTDESAHAAEALPSVPESVPNTMLGPSIVLERQLGIEVELVGGRRVRFDRDLDPETVRRFITVLEGDPS
jgi:transposase-like protein